MKKIIIVSLASIALSYTVYGQSKPPEVKPVSKTYIISIDSVSFKAIDSILQRSHYFVGRSMPFEEADLLKQAFAQVINFFLAEKQKQDGIKPKSPNK